MTSRPWAYRLGAYAVYPALAAAGGALLARARSNAELVAAAALLGAALVLPGFLGRWCRRCGERLLPRLLRLLVLPAAVMTALAFRSPQRSEQYIALALIGLSAVAFSAAWRLSAPASPSAGP